MATMLMYLSDVEEGGETSFPDGEWVDGGGPPPGPDPSACAASDGTWVRPAKGDALFFYSLDPTGDLDIASLHRGCPVLRGEKWSATLWIHNAPVDETGRTIPAQKPPPGPCRDIPLFRLVCRRMVRNGKCTDPAMRAELFGTRTMEGNCMRSCGRCNDDGSFKVRVEAAAQAGGPSG